MKKFKTLKDVEEALKNETCPPKREREARYFRDACFWKILGNLVYDQNCPFYSNEGQNIAGVCFGYAFELFYKVLILIENEESKKKGTDQKEPEKTHKLIRLHKQLNSNNQKKIEKIINKITKHESIRFLESIDRTLTSPQRRYYRVKAQRLNERVEGEILWILPKILNSLQNFIIEEVKIHYSPFEITETSSKWLFEVLKKNINDLIKKRCEDYHCKEESM